MSIVRYDPFRELRSLQDDMNRLFTTAFPRGGEGEGLQRGVWNPSVDIAETQNAIVLEADLRFVYPFVHLAAHRHGRRRASRI